MVPPCTTCKKGARALLEHISARHHSGRASISQKARGMSRAGRIKPCANQGSIPAYQGQLGECAKQGAWAWKKHVLSRA
eukprot:1161957-Pelagomonas_calceolata.AAC.2